MFLSIAFAIATACSAMLAVYYARQVERCGVSIHRRWATRCLILLFSAIWLRITGGLITGWEMDSEILYRLIAWLRWLLPLGVYELVWRYRRWPRSLQLFG